jgi:arylformamidase
MIFDISVPISSTLPLYKGDPPAEIVRVADFDRGDAMTLSRMAMGAHTGTHVDAPLHFIRGGGTVDQLDLQVLIGPARVVELPPVVGEIAGSDLEAAHLPAGTQRILFKTRNSTLWSQPGFQEDFVALGVDGARWLLARGVRLVAIDYLSIEAFGSRDFPVHQLLLSAGVVIVEAVNLEGIPEGEYQLICLPIKLQGAEGAPARALLIQT